MPELFKANCLRCGHVWYPRQIKINVCPKCKSRLWNKHKFRPENIVDASVVISGLKGGDAWYEALGCLRYGFKCVKMPDLISVKDHGYFLCDDGTGEGDIDFDQVPYDVVIVVKKVLRAMGYKFTVSVLPVGERA